MAKQFFTFSTMCAALQTDKPNERSNLFSFDVFSGTKNRNTEKRQEVDDNMQTATDEQEKMNLFSLDDASSETLKNNENDETKKNLFSLDIFGLSLKGSNGGQKDKSIDKSLSPESFTPNKTDDHTKNRFSLDALSFRSSSVDQTGTLSEKSLQTSATKNDENKKNRFSLDTLGLSWDVEETDRISECSMSSSASSPSNRNVENKKNLFSLDTLGFKSSSANQIDSMSETSSVSSMSSVSSVSSTGSSSSNNNEEVTMFAKEFCKIPYKKAFKSFPWQTFYLFSYGYNDLTVMADRMKIDKKVLEQNSYAAVLNNWSRAFFGNKKGRAGSVATIIPDEGSVVYGIVHVIRKEKHGFTVGGHKISMETLYHREGVKDGFYKFQKFEVSESKANVKLFNKKNNSFAAPGISVWVYGGNHQVDPFNCYGKQFEPAGGYKRKIQAMLKDRAHLMGEKNEELGAKEERKELPVTLLPNTRWFYGFMNYLK